MAGGQPVPDEYLRGRVVNEVRCPCCEHLLFKVMGLGCIIEIVCRRCGAMIRWPEVIPKVTREPKRERI